MPEISAGLLLLALVEAFMAEQIDLNCWSEQLRRVSTSAAGTSRCLGAWSALLVLNERMNLLDGRMGGLADEVALRLSMLFSERVARLEGRFSTRLRELEETRP